MPCVPLLAPCPGTAAQTARSGEGGERREVTLVVP